MKKMNWKIGCLIILFVASLSGISMAQKVIQTDPGKMQHPRILLLSGEENIIKQSVAANPTWKMMTSADVKLGANSILLSKEGHTLSVRINATSKIKMKTWSTGPTTTYDAPNPGKTLVGFEMQLKPNQKAGIEVLLVPGSVKEKKMRFEKELGEW